MKKNKSIDPWKSAYMMAFNNYSLLDDNWPSMNLTPKDVSHFLKTYMPKPAKPVKRGKK